MRAYLVPVILGLSAAMNVAFLAVWASGSPLSATPAPPASGSPPARIGCPLFQRIGVTEDQWAALEPRWREYRRTANARCVEIHRLRLELVDLLAVPQTDPVTLRKHLDDIAAGQREVQEMLVSYLLDQKASLSEEQRRHLFAMIRRQTECVGHGAPSGGCGETGEQHRGCEK